MSLLKIIIGVVVVVSAALYGFIHFTNQGTDTTPPPVQLPIDTAPTTQNTETSMNNANDTSDEAITADLSSVDSELQGLSTDTANVEAGLNDKPVAQTE